MIFRRILYFIMLYAIFAYSVLYRTYDSFIMLVFFVSVTLLSLIMLILSRIFMKYSFEQKTLYVPRTQEYTVRYNIKNSMPFPITGVSILFDGLKKPQSFTVGAANTAIVTKKDKQEHCGCYYTAIQTMCLYDFFHIFSLKIKNPGVVKIISLPRLFGVNTKEYVKSMLYAKDEIDKAESNGSDVNGVREYTDGDSLKNIHHKLSCRTSKLIVKEYEAEDADDDGFLFYGNGADYDSGQLKVRDIIYEFMYNVMYLRLEKKGKITGYISDCGAVTAMNITSKDMLDEYFERVYEQSGCDSGNHCNIPSGTFIFAAAFSEALYDICAGAKDKSFVLYLPDSERIQCKNSDAEVIYIAAGGEEY